jgi:hypothetical protein
VAELDLETLRRTPRAYNALPPEFATKEVVTVDGATWDAILAVLERAEEVAGQGCEFCDAMVDDPGEERDGGREPHAHWWACGRCWNAGAQEMSAIIGHLSELLDAALERVPELERERDELVEKLTDATWARPVGMLSSEIEERFPGLKVVHREEWERAERVEAAARTVVAEADKLSSCRPTATTVALLRSVLAAREAEEVSGG